MSNFTLEVNDLNVRIVTDNGPIHIVREVSLTVAPGEVVGLVGESGSGKSVTMMSLVRLLDEKRTVIDAKDITVCGQSLIDLRGGDLGAVRGSVVSYIFQDPMTALNPLLSAGRQITESLRRHKNMSRAAARQRAIELLRSVGISAPEIRVDQKTHQMSGGIRQRVMIAIALAADPKLLIADEPTTALDVTTQAEIVKLLQTLQRERGMSMVWVTHDLALLARLADRVVVMYAGRVVEEAASARLYANPGHPYTAGLLASSSHIDDPFAEQEPIPGGPPDPRIVSAGCSFAPRCSRAQARCHGEVPRLTRLDADQSVACFYPIARSDQ